MSLAKQVRLCVAAATLIFSGASALAGTSSSAGDEPDHTISIAFGTYYGECLGYCVEVYELRKSPVFEDKLMTRTRHGWDRTDAAHPIISETKPLTSEEFQRLTALANIDRFAQLADTYGCPDCADGGAYWIRVQSQFGVRGQVNYGSLEDVKAALDPQLFARFFEPMHAALFGDLRARFEGKAVKLYPPETTSVSPLCDMHTKLVLQPVAGLGFVAVLKADLTEPAACDAHPDPRARAYRVRAATTDACSSTYYEGVFYAGNQTFTATVADHRLRTCDDRPLDVEVTETDAAGVVTQLVGRESDVVYYP
jgi:hypothetical protein